MRPGSPLLGAAVVLLLAAAQPAAAQIALPSGRVIRLFDTAIQQVLSIRSGAMAPASAMRELLSIWNPQACSFTDLAMFKLSRPILLQKLDIWYRWQPQESSLPYQLIAVVGGRSRVVHRGLLHRDSCDTYQQSWCIGSEAVQLELGPALYGLKTARPWVCQNQASEGTGFIKVWGRATVR